MRSQSILHDDSLRSPRAKATTWRVLRQMAINIQHLLTFLKTFHPTLRHHPTEMEAMSLLMLDWPHLFFEQRSKCLPTDTEHAGNASHARSFIISTDYFYFFAPARAKIFAPILLLALSIMSVFYAVTVVASVGDDFLYHHPIPTHHLLFYHYPFLYSSLSYSQDSVRLLFGGTTGEKQLIAFIHDHRASFPSIVSSLGPSGASPAWPPGEREKTMAH